MIAIRADLLDFTAAPRWGDTGDGGHSGHGGEPAVRWRPDHWLLVDAQGRIAGVQPGAVEPGPAYARDDQRGRLLLPGFIDTHVHSPQIEVIASFGTELLDWLQRYTFPAERAWADPAVAAAGSARFLDALLAHGTTAAVVFPTVHKGSAEALFQAAQQRGMRLVAGKVLMDRHAPDGLRDDDLAQAERDCVDLIERWHGRGRNAYAVTVRFAPTSTPAQLAMAGALCRADASLYLQTHVAENRVEVQWVQRLFPAARSYLDVYAQAGLLHPRSVLAHGIWLDEADLGTLRDSGAQIAFCPSSNLFLGSGLMDWPQRQAAGVAVSVGSDVGGGTSLSLPRTLADGYKVQALAGHRLTAWTALHAATRGAADALKLAHEIGSLDAGCLADVCLWDWSRDAVGERRLAVAQDLHEKLFAWMTLADAGHLAATYVAGRRLYTRADR
ncbi:MAG: guanine deaminase [Proteobacteria bacterium]|nr:guanine deaminase [Pseudomonadota bacterium]